MTKIVNRELARVLMEKHDLDRQAAEDFIVKLADVLNDALRMEKQVKVKGLGTFKVTSVASRKSVDVNTGEAIIIEGRDKISFTPDNAMRDLVNRPFAQFETVVVNDGVDFDEIDQKFAEGIPAAELLAQLDEADEENSEVQTSTEPVSPDSVGETTVPTPEVPVKAPEAPVKAPGVSNEDTEPSQPLMLNTAQLAMLNGSMQQEEVPADDSAHAEALHSEAVAETRSDTVVTAADRADAKGAAMLTHAAPLKIDNDQLARLNGTTTRQEEAEEDTVQQEEETTEEGPIMVEEPAPTAASPLLSQEEAPAEEGQETENEDLSAQEPTATPLRVKEDELEDIKEHSMELNQMVKQQHRLFKFIILAACALLLLCIGGIVYFATELEKRNNRIEHLEAQAVMLHNAEAKATRPSVKMNPTVKAEGNAAQTKAEAQKQKAQEVAEAHAKAEARIKAEQAEAQKAEEARRLKAAAEKVAREREAAEKAAAERAAAQKKAEQASANATAYDRDPRVRTGAYVIVGIDHTVTVRSGQTLTSISKANLGPGMECYVEAVNGGATTFKAGDKVKIPKLRLKKK
jgi:nucleoid DNA-binding protein